MVGLLVVSFVSATMGIDKWYDLGSPLLSLTFQRRLYAGFCKAGLLLFCRRPAEAPCCEEEESEREREK